jgi:hypothetical protein
VRSQFNEYDGLERLKKSVVGSVEFDAQTHVPSVVTGSITRTDTWSM